MSGLKLFHTMNGGLSEVAPRLAEVEADVQHLIEAHMETMLGVRFLASEYGTGPVHGGRIDSLGLDENDAPVVVEYKRGTDAGVINQGLFYLAWLMDHRAEFGYLVRERLGAAAASRVRWSAPRLICVAGDVTRYDVHAVREHRRCIDLVRYRFYGEQFVGSETVASIVRQAAVSGCGAAGRAAALSVHPCVGREGVRCCCGPVGAGVASPVVAGPFPEQAGGRTPQVGFPAPCGGGRGGSVGDVTRCAGRCGEPVRLGGGRSRVSPA
ncbi:hypothetical protein [Streptomyces paromomycinus]|uniref:Transporter n=1 Tax=Streptomyces paromomycinus TaxID=92743 RepID=A0A401VUN0_STREY|nr:hypothetical protein [Streptomyces paromomycinus]GCD40780.1 transporter [Streptomyces paromomycinus]